MLFHLATEDELSEEVGCRLISELGSNCEIGIRFRKNGFGYLKTKIKSFRNIALQDPLLLITDLDNAACPSLLISDWMDNLTRPNGLLFRIAVREIEAWLLADHDGMRRLLVKGAVKLPNDADALQDPKFALLSFAKKAPRDVRTDLLKAPGAIASQGLGYNQRMGDFVRNIWNPKLAAARSESLARTIKRLQLFTGTSNILA